MTGLQGFRSRTLQLSDRALEQLDEIFAQPPYRAGDVVSVCGHARTVYYVDGFAPPYFLELDEPVYGLVRRPSNSAVRLIEAAPNHG